MRINVLQHTPNEGPGAIKEWSHERGHEMYIYHPYNFNGKLPKADETDMLIILGGPMSPNDSDEWIVEERILIKELVDGHKPIFGACYGAQQIAKTLGCEISKAPFKEVGWAPVYKKTDCIHDLPKELVVLHWHEEMFEIPQEAELMFSSELVKNQGFIMKNIIGLQFHFEPEADDIREIVINDSSYAESNNALKQSPTDIINFDIPAENKVTIFKLLDYIAEYRY